MQLNKLRDLVTAALEEIKAVDLAVLEVTELTTVMDLMVVVTGTSNRHVKALANNVLETAAAVGIKPLGVEGEREAEWILVDFGVIVVHIMQPQIRAFYGLERLWDRDLWDANSDQADISGQ